MAAYPAKVERLIESVLAGSGVTSPSLRRTVAGQAARLGGMSGETEALPQQLDGFVRKVATQAYRVTDEDITALKEAGYSEDTIFEITVSAALGASIARLECGLNALKGEG